MTDQKPKTIVEELHNCMEDIRRARRLPPYASETFYVKDGPLFQQYLERTYPAMVVRRAMQLIEESI